MGKHGPGFVVNNIRKMKKKGGDCMDFVRLYRPYITTGSLTNTSVTLKEPTNISMCIQR